MKVMQLNSLEDTTLWRRLNQDGNSVSTALAANLIAVCEEACDRMKAMPAFAPQYTLHDERHLLRTTELMALILGETLDILNPLEIALLILAAHFHDQGMVPEVEEYKTLTKTQEFQVFRGNWYLEHPNRNEIDHKLGNPALSPEERGRLSKMLADLNSAMLTDYFRTTHALRSAEIVRSRYDTDKRLEVAGINLSELTAKLCASHCESADNLSPSNGFNYDELIGTSTVNMPFLSIILRLADILDFDRERTPDSLYRTIHFTSNVSMGEWEKHRGVHGWTISPDRIRFSMQFDHPIYEAAARHFMNSIDRELSDCHELCRSFPVEFAKYRLCLPQKVDRSRIGPRGNSYVYYDLEFALSRDEIVRFLMTDNLYSSPSICVRELLQNSLDALRYRKALYACDGLDWKDGRVRMEHSIDENGFEIIQCRDNGVGMDEKVVTKFFTRVGRSYYRSPEFEQQRAEFRRHSTDFDPCSQFGIGFMSCFMLGDRIKVETRRDYGMGKEHGKPLIVEINGLSSILVIREGPLNQPVGTTVTIVSRQKPAFFDEWADKVLLTTVLKGYALATEFPVHGRCTIPEINDEIVIPSEPEPIPTKMEFCGMKNIMTFEQPFFEIDNRLRGWARESFLINDHGIPTTENSEASWRAGPRHSWELFKSSTGQAVERYPWEHGGIVLCTDGILLAGEPGRPNYYDEVRMRLGMRTSGIGGPGATLIDVRGELKPEITPARTPPRDFGPDRSPSWRRLQRYVDTATGRLWGKLTDYLTKGLSHEEFWKLGNIYGAWFPNISHQKLWEHVAVPVVDADGVYEWKKINALGKVTIEPGNESLQLAVESGSKIGLYKSLEEWAESGSEQSNLGWQMNALGLLLCSAMLEGGTVMLHPEHPRDPSDTLANYHISSFFVSIGFLIPFVGEASGALTVQTHYPLANRAHPLSQIYLESRFLAKKTDIQEFASSFVPCLAETVSLREDQFSLAKPRRWLKYTAHRYFAVAWSNYNDNVKPPYIIWLQDKGWTEVNEEDFRKWINMP